MRNTLTRYVYAGRYRRPVPRRCPAWLSAKYMRPRPPFVRLYDLQFAEREVGSWGLSDVVIRRRPEPRP